MDIDINIQAAEEFLARHDATTRAMLEDVEAIQAAFRHFCAAWRDAGRDAGRDAFEEDLTQFARDLTQALEDLEEDKAFLRRVIEAARKVEIGGGRQAFE